MVLYYDLFHSIYMLITEIKPHWWKMHFVGMFKFRLSFYIMAVKGIFHLSVYATQLQLHFV